MNVINPESKEFNLANRKKHKSTRQSNQNISRNVNRCQGRENTSPAQIARNSLIPPPTPGCEFFRCEFSYSRLRYLSTTFGKAFCSEKKWSTKLFVRVKRVDESSNSRLRCAFVKFRPLLTLNLLGQFSRGTRYNPYTWWYGTDKAAFLVANLTFSPNPGFHHQRRKIREDTTLRNDQTRVLIDFFTLAFLSACMDACACVPTENEP